MRTWTCGHHCMWISVELSTLHQLATSLTALCISRLRIRYLMSVFKAALSTGEKKSRDRAKVAIVIEVGRAEVMMAKASRVDSKMEVDLKQADARQGLAAMQTPEAPATPVSVHLTQIAQQLEEKKSKEKAVTVPEAAQQLMESLANQATEGASHLASPWNTPEALMRGTMAIFAARKRQEKMDENWIVMWGKYSGKPINAVLQDHAYAKWLLMNVPKIQHPEGIQVLTRVQKEYQVEGKALVRNSPAANVPEPPPDGMSMQQIQQMVQQEIARAFEGKHAASS